MSKVITMQTPNDVRDLLLANAQVLSGESHTYTRKHEIVHLINNLPSSVFHKWWTAHDIAFMLNRGEAVTVKSTEIGDAVKYD